MIRRVGCSLAALLFTVTASAVGQTVTDSTGAITGTVTDSTQGILPGVTVTLTSPNMAGTQTAVTDERGSYSFSTLAPGVYRIAFELGGFGGVVREGIRVGVSFTATINVVMTPGGLAETITVSGVSPVVDTQSTSVTTRFETKDLETLGGSRDFWAVVAQLPAVSMQQMDVGGSGVLRQQPYTAYGLTPSQQTTALNRNDVEGIRAGGANGTAADFYYADFNSFEEIAVTAVGQSASSPVAGTFTRFISKSGGNVYRGQIYFDYQNKTMQSRNIDARQIAAGLTTTNPAFDVTDLNRIEYLRDFSADVGGFILKDKLWWYGAYRYTTQAQRFPFFDGLQENKAPVYTGKVTYNITPQQRLIAYRQYSNKEVEDYFLANNTFFDSSSTVPRSPFPTQVNKLEYNRSFTNVFFDARAGWYQSDFLTFGKSDGPRIEDIGSRIRTGGPADGGLPRMHPQVNGSLSYFKNGWIGSHNFKIGGEFRRDELENLQGVVPFACSCTSTLNNGVPTQVRVFLGANSSFSSIDTIGFFMEDQWQISERLTVTYGLRLDRYLPFLPTQTGPEGSQFPRTYPLLTWNNLGPRLGASYDLTGDGKTVLKASFGNYFVYPSVYLAQAVNPNPAAWFVDYQWTTDLNRNGYWDRGEEGREIGRAGGGAATSLDPNLKNPFVRQASLFAEREILPNFGVRTGFVWNGERDAHRVINAARPLADYSVPVQAQDPGPDGRFGSSDDGAFLTLYTLTPEALARTAVNRTQNLPLNQDHFTWEVTGTRRQTGRWSMLASFAYTRSYQAALGAGTNFTPNALLNTNAGDRNLQTSWQAKLNGGVDLPWNLRLIPIVRHQSGSQYARTFVRNLPHGNVTVRAEPFGARRFPNITIVDLRSEKRFAFGERSISGFFDVYNIFNTNREQDLTIASGASFLRPLLVTSPRVARLGVRLQW
jgi:hypothetical protein